MNELLMQLDDLKKNKLLLKLEKKIEDFLKFFSPENTTFSKKTDETNGQSKEIYKKFYELNSTQNRLIFMKNYISTFNTDIKEYLEKKSYSLWSLLGCLLLLVHRWWLYGQQNNRGWDYLILLGIYNLNITSIPKHMVECHEQARYFN